MENTKKCAVRGLTKRGQLVASQKSVSDKQWYERYFSQEYYDRKDFLENFEKEVYENTDANICLYVPAFEISTLKKDLSTQRSMTMKLLLSKKYAQKLQSDYDNENKNIYLCDTVLETLLVA